jgi:AcrR family transcriptional regulator
VPHPSDFKPGPRDERGVLAARILEVARTEFAENGYAGTTVRGVARKSDVDAALVYHYYRSKEELLDACLQPPAEFLARSSSIWAVPIDELGTTLVRQLLDNWNSPDIAPIFRAILLIAAHHENTRQRLRGTVVNQLMGPSRIGVDESDRLTRSALVSSQMLGLAMMRYIWKIEPLASMTDEDVITTIAPTIQRYINGDLGIPSGETAEAD